MHFDDCYGNEKMNQIKSFLRKFWLGEEKVAFSSYPSQPEYRQLDEYDKMCNNAAQNILAGASLPGYNVPRLIADFGTVSTASYWGGERYKPVGGCIGIKPVIYCSEDVDRACPGSAYEGDVKRAVELWKGVSARLETSKLPCSCIDIQGPLNTAALLWKQDEFMMAMYSEPSKVHQLLEQVTEQIISIIHAMQASIKELAGPVWPYIWLPNDIGIGITEDYMPLISPKLYQEFGIPYVEKISQEFGGVFIHCCGEYNHQLETLRKSKANILGLEFHFPYTDPVKLFTEFGNSMVFVPFLGPHGVKEYPKKSDFIRYLLNIKHSDTRLWFILTPEEEDFQKQAALIEGMI